MSPNAATKGDSEVSDDDIIYTSYMRERVSTNGCVFPNKVLPRLC
jgi:hypothetical protein